MAGKAGAPGGPRAQAVGAALVAAPWSLLAVGCQGLFGVSLEGMRGLPVFHPTPKSLPSSSWGGKGLSEAGVPPGPTGGSQGLRVQILFAFNSIFPVGEEEQVDSAEPSGDQAAAAASLRQMANAFATVARASVRCVDRSEAEIGKRTSRARRKVTRCRSVARFPPALAPVVLSGLLVS